MKPTKSGYMRYRADGRKQFEHRLVWEAHYGPLPDGMQIHHKDGDKTNNAIENLMAVTPKDHRRYHAGCRLIDGKWYKRCPRCGEWKEITDANWYFKRATGWITDALCRPCYAMRARERRKIKVSPGCEKAVV